MPKPDLSSPLAVEELFRAAAALPAADRAAYLEVACQGQPAVRARLERMLALGGIAALLQHGRDETVPMEIEAERARLQPEDVGERIGNKEARGQSLDPRKARLERRHLIANFAQNRPGSVRRGPQLPRPAAHRELPGFPRSGSITWPRAG
jgi:hypothetical protein